MKKIILAALMLSLAGQGFAAPVKTRTTKKKTPLKSSSSKASSTAAKPATLKATVLDNFETADWAPSSHEGTEIAAEAAPGVQGSALKVKYDLKTTGQWVQISKGFDIAGIRGKAFDFQLKGTGASNNLEIKLVDADGSVFGHKLMGVTSQGSWKRFRIKDQDFAYWWGGDKVLNGVREIFFAISADAGGAGEVTLDELLLVQLQPAAPQSAASGSGGGASTAAGVIDDGADPAVWTTGKGDGSDCTVTSDGSEGKTSVAFKYTIPPNQWASMRKNARMTLAATDVLLLSVKMTGDPNKLEFKVIDQDDSTFAKIFEGISTTSGWLNIRVPVSELQYMWGGDNRLDMENIEFFELAVSGPGGKGTVLLDSIKVAK